MATHDGHSERIARHVCGRLTERGVTGDLRVLPKAGTDKPVDATAPAVVLIAAVRYGRHLPEAVAFLARYKATRTPPPLAFASVNLTARRKVTNNPYLRKILARARLTPAIATAFGGCLDYPRYRWFDRLAIRLIMALTGGPTDGRCSVEYTRWEQVDAFADEVAALARRRPS